jgi:gluconate 2-dehydrogenase gamma chain
MTNPLSRRDLLKSLTMGAACSALGAIPIQAAEYAHRVIAAEKATGAIGYKPKFFSPHQFKTLRMLCETILPADGDSGGAIEAGAPEFIDLLTSENPEYQLRLGGGLMWLDSACADRNGNTYSNCTPQQQKEMLDSIAYRKHDAEESTPAPGVEFFSFLRNLTADGFFTSKIGIEYLGYVGNTFLTGFPGCPPVEGV